MKRERSGKVIVALMALCGVLMGCEASSPEAEEKSAQSVEKPTGKADEGVASGTAVLQK
ncbi:MAG: hypothetical protein OHK0029_31520 [Armatimonadaceae bacterium]